MIYSKFTQSI